MHVIEELIVFHIGDYEDQGVYALVGAKSKSIKGLRIMRNYSIVRDISFSELDNLHRIACNLLSKI